MWVKKDIFQKTGKRQSERKTTADSEPCMQFAC